MEHKIKLVYAIGDSFAFGQGLSGFIHNKNGHAIFNMDLQNTVFSGIMKQKLSIPFYKNAAMPGSSNDRTHRHLLSEMVHMISNGILPENMFVVVSMTHAARHEVFSNGQGVYRQLINNSQPSEKGTELYSYWSTYVSYFDNIAENVDRYLMQVISIQTFLEKYNIRYIMTDSMSELPEFYEYIRSNKSRMLKFINRKTYPEMPSFHAWAADKGFKPTPCHHLYEDAHAAWADHLLDYIRDNDILKE